MQLKKTYKLNCSFIHKFINLFDVISNAKKELFNELVYTNYKKSTKPMKK